VAEDYGLERMLPKDTDEVVRALASSFGGTSTSLPEPSTDWILGDGLSQKWEDPRRQQYARWMMRVTLSKAQASDGHIFVARTSDGGVGGCCIFYLRAKDEDAEQAELNDWSDTIRAVLRSGLPPWWYLHGGLLAAESRAQTRRMLRAQGIEESFHRRHLSQRHLYVNVMAVDPQCQGQGFAGKLMRATCAIADRAQVPCYLDTAGRRLASIYQRFGYSVVDEQALVCERPRRDSEAAPEPYVAMLRPCPAAA